MAFTERQTWFDSMSYLRIAFHFVFYVQQVISVVLLYSRVRIQMRYSMITMSQKYVK